MKKNLPLLLAASFIAAVLAASIALGAQYSEEESHKSTEENMQEEESHGQEESTESDPSEEAH